MSKQIFIRVLIGFLALLLFSKAGMATTLYSDKNTSEAACVVQSSDNLEQKGIIEPILQLQSPASTSRMLKFIQKEVKVPEGSTFDPKKQGIRYFLYYHHTNLYKGISIYLFNCILII